MGHMDVIGFISDGFNIYFPIAIVLLCALTLFNVGTRILNMVGIQQFMVDDDITQELVDEGKEIVRRGLDSVIPFCRYLTVVQQICCLFLSVMCIFVRLLLRTGVQPTLDQSAETFPAYSGPKR